GGLAAWVTRGLLPEADGFSASFACSASRSMTSSVWLSAGLFLLPLLPASSRRMSLSEGLFPPFGGRGRDAASGCSDTTLTSLSLGRSATIFTLLSPGPSLLLRPDLDEEPPCLGPESSSRTSESRSIWKSRLLSITSRTSLSPLAGLGDGERGPDLPPLEPGLEPASFSFPMGVSPESRLKSM